MSLQIDRVRTKSGSDHPNIQATSDVWIDCPTISRLGKLSSVSVIIRSLSEYPFEMDVSVDGNKYGENWQADFDIEQGGSIHLRLGYDIPPSFNSIQLVVTDNGVTTHGDRFPIYVNAFVFLIEAKEFTCIVETTETSGSDEIVTAWFYAADSYVNGRVTRQYGDVDAGKTYVYDENERQVMRSVVRRRFALDVGLTDWDTDEDPSSDQGLTSVSSKFGQLIGTGTGVVSIVAVAFIVITLGIDIIIEQFSDPDSVGTGSISFSAAELIKLTDNASLKYVAELPIGVSDSTGKYLFFLSITRL